MSTRGQCDGLLGYGIDLLPYEKVYILFDICHSIGFAYFFITRASSDSSQQRKSYKSIRLLLKIILSF